MIFFYDLGIRLYKLILRIAALRNIKARQWLNGQRDILQIISTHINTNQEYVWFHFASLGEFEQGRPVMEQMKKEYPHMQLFITFFSPSGYEIRKHNTLTDATFYLPLDTRKNADQLIKLINPKIAVFTKYEYWYHYYKTLNASEIPVFVISANFMKGMSFFKWYGKINRKMLKFVTHFFVQNDSSKGLLATLGFTNVTVTGDTRFDRVSKNAQAPRNLELINRFCKDKKVFIGGSTWPEEEELIIQITRLYPDWKFILAPHEIGEEKINELQKLVPDNSVRYSELSEADTGTLQVEAEDEKPQSAGDVVSHQVLIIDNIGMLSSLYQFADIAYIGGAFGSGLHNVLEAAAFGVPVIFGPKHDRFPEAKQLLAEGAGFSIGSYSELRSVMEMLSDPSKGKTAGEAARRYVQKNTGATRLIMDHIRTVV